MRTVRRSFPSSRKPEAYVANTGYGWGLRFGVGYAERLVEIFTEELIAGGTRAVGDAVNRSKQRYFLETPRFDPYDEKSLMQWTVYGLPMYAVKTGIDAGGGGAAPAHPPFTGPAPAAPDLPESERFGPVTVQRRWDGAVAGSSTEGDRLGTCCSTVSIGRPWAPTAGAARWPRHHSSTRTTS